MNKLFAKIKSEYEFRTYVFAAISIIISLIFAIFNTVLAFLYNASWNIGIAVYYYILAFERTVVCSCEVKWYKAGLDESEKEQKRKKLYFAQSIVLLILDLALVTPISLMVLQQKAVNYSIIVAISIAAFTTYKIIMSSKGYFKTRKNYNLGVRILKNLNFIEALVSVLSLQYTLIMTVDGSVQGDMFVLCAVTSFAIWALVVAVSLVSLVRSIIILKRKRT